MNIDTSNQRDVWIVKVPKYLANAWRGANGPLGKLQVPKNGLGPMKYIADTKLAIEGEHSLSLRPLDHQQMVVLAKAPDAADVSFEGNVKQRGELRPKGDQSYMSLKTISIKKAAQPTAVTKMLVKAVTSYKPRSANQLAHQAELRKKKDKLLREDKEVVQGRLFSAFEKQQYYNIKDLVKITNQPIPYLKEILKEICNYCSKSTHKNMWELKPEYRHYKTTES